MSVARSTVTKGQPVFNEQTLMEWAPVQHEQRELNLEEWRKAVRQHADHRAQHGVELGRLFRVIHSRVPKAQARAEIEAQGFSPLSAAALMKQAAKADGIEVAAPAPKARDPLKVTKEMAAAILEFEDRPEELFDYMRSRARG